VVVGATYVGAKELASKVDGAAYEDGVIIIDLGDTASLTEEAGVGTTGACTTITGSLT
jgi:hypothetical protein